MSVQPTPEHGDNVGGDKIGGDKVGNDKVGGDKTTVGDIDGSIAAVAVPASLFK